MGKLAKVLEYTYAGDNERKEILNQSNFPKDIKQLLLSEEGTGSDNLLNIELENALHVGAEKRSVIRKLIPTIDVNEYRAVVPSMISPSGCVDKVSEGAAFPTMKATFASGTVEINKYATSIPITHELIEDGQWDIIEILVQRAGALLENTLNKVGMTQLLDGHHATKPADIDPAESHITTYDIALAREYLKKLYWGNSRMSFIGYPTAIRYLLSKSSVSGSTELGITPNTGDDICGVEVYELMTPLEVGATSYWDATDSANHYYGMVIDSDNYAVIGMRQDIKIESNIKDPAFDLTKLVASMRFGVKVINSQAAVRILSK